MFFMEMLRRTNAMHFPLMKQTRYIILGLLALGATVLWVANVKPWLLEIPRDFYFTANIISTDNFYNEEEGHYAGIIYSRTRFSYEAVAEETGVLIIKNLFDVRTPDNEPIFSVKRLYGIDQVTGMHISGYGDRDRDGYLFAPQHLQRGEPFTYWHINYDGPAHMSFVGEETLYGLPVYRYETTYDDVAIDQTENLTYLPGVGVTRGVELEPHLTLWVEPVSGKLIKYADDTIAYFYDLKTKERLDPWNHFSNTFDEISVQENTIDARFTKTKMRIVELYIPSLLLIIAIFSFLRIIIDPQTCRRVCSRNNLRRANGICILSIAILSFFGWMIGSEHLFRFLPFGAAMNPFTALCFILLAIIILLSQSKQKYIPILLGVIILMIGGIRLAEYGGLISFKIDLLLFREKILSTEFSSRMAGNTALGFLLLGSVPLIAHIPLGKRLQLASIFPTIVILFSVFALFAQLFEAIQVFNIPPFSLTAFHAAALFLFASFSVYEGYSESKNTLSLQGWLGISGLLFVTILLTVIFTLLTARIFEQDEESNFLEQTVIVSKSIEDRIHTYVGALRAGKGLFVSSTFVSRDEWQAFVEGLDIQTIYPGIQGMGYSIFVKPEELSAHIASMRAEGFPDFTVRPPGERDIYSSIIYLEPFDDRNKQAFGFDMFQEPNRRLAMEQARDTGQPWMSARITLVQEIDEDVQPGFLIYVPYYGNNSEPTSVSERRDAIIGYIYAPFRSRDFVEGVLGNTGIPNIGLRITDGTSTDEENVLYDDTKNILDTSKDLPRFTETNVIYVAGRPWVLQFSSSANYGETTMSRIIPLVVLFAGIIISSLISFLYATVVASREKALLYAKKVTRDLEESKAKDEAILSALNKAALVTIMDKNRKIIFANDNLLHVTGYSQKEIIGKDQSMLKASQKKDVEFVKIWKTVENGGVWRGEVLDKTKDGSLFWVDMTVSPILDGSGHPREYLAVRFLITDKKEAEQRLQSSLTEVQKFKRAVESSNESIVITDPSGSIQYVNPTFTRLTGYTFEEAIGKNPKILQSGKTPRAVYETMWSTISKGETFMTDELINKRKDGTEYYADIAIYPIMDDGKTTLQFYVAVQRDVTQRKKEERAKSEFVSIASHQLRTPLTAIRWSLGRFKKVAPDSMDSNSIELLDAATAASKRMSETINAMLNMSRIAAGKITPEIAEIHLCEVFEELRKEVAQQYEAKKIVFQSVCDNDWVLQTDLKLFKEIVSNLLTNAIKYTPNKGKVTLEVKKDKKVYTIEVRDTGYGIPKDQQEKIFTKFFRADNILNREPDGNGIGLYLVKELAQLLGGTVAFQSTLNKGTTFTVSLPLSPSTL